MTYTNERMKRATLRAVKAESIEGFPQADCGSGWWVEAHGMRASDVADCGLTSENVAILFASAPKMLADLAVAREMLAAKDAEIAKHAERWGQVDRMREAIDLLTRQRDELAKTLAERDALCEQQTRTIHGIPALMQERDAEKARADAAEQELNDAWAATGVASTVRGLTTLADVASTWREERDDAEQMVCEMRGVLRYYATRDFDSRGYSDSQLQAPADAALARTEPVAGRWVPVAEHADAVRCVISRQERIEALEAERADLIAAKEAAEAAHTSTISAMVRIATERNDAIERAEQAESREHALGVQVVALQKRLALATTVVEEVRLFKDSGFHGGEPMIAALAALDAVPGDALAPTVDYREASGVDVERVSVAVPTCKTCNDTHEMPLDDRMVMCTRCPVPCQSCRAGGNGPFCETTPCVCACHVSVKRTGKGKATP